MTNDKGVAISSDFYKVIIPRKLVGLLLDFIDKAALKPLFDSCIAKRPRTFTSDVTQSTKKWNLRLRPQHSTSDMYWISPADKECHFSLLSYLGSGGLYTVLTAIASVCETSVLHLTVYQLTFLVVSVNNSTWFHIDYDPDLAGQVWTIMIPIIVVPESESSTDLVVKQSSTNSEHFIKYRVGEAFVWGCLLEHSTAAVSYNGKYRVCLSISVGFITSDNVKLFLPDITQQYPPKKCALLLQWAKAPHWAASHYPVSTSLPSVPEEVLLGKEWLDKLNELKKMLATGIKNEKHYSKSLRQWMAYQRYCYSLKQGMNEGQKQSRNCQSAQRTFTFAREHHLTDIDFVFACDRDEGVFHKQWVEMFEELQKFYEEHGHYKVNRARNRRLYVWISNQRKYLSDSSKLTNERRKRREILLKAGLKL